MSTFDLASSGSLTLDGVVSVLVALALVRHVRDGDLLHQLHVLFLEQTTVLEALLDFRESRALHTCADGVSEALVPISGLAEVDRNVLLDSFVENLANERHVGLGFERFERWMVW